MNHKILSLLIIIGVVFLVAESQSGADSKDFNVHKSKSQDDGHLHEPHDKDDKKNKDKDSKKKVVQKIVGQVMKWYDWYKEIEEKNNPGDKKNERESKSESE